MFRCGCRGFGQFEWRCAPEQRQRGKPARPDVLSGLWATLIPTRARPWRTLFERVLRAVVTQKFRRSIQAKLKDVWCRKILFFISLLELSRDDLRISQGLALPRKNTSKIKQKLFQRSRQSLRLLPVCEGRMNVMSRIKIGLDAAEV
jgi:hypothetical protein